MFHKQRNNEKKTKYLTFTSIRVINYVLYDFKINYKNYNSKLTNLVVFEQWFVIFQVFTSSINYLTEICTIKKK